MCIELVEKRRKPKGRQLEVVLASQGCTEMVEVYPQTTAWGVIQALENKNPIQYTLLPQALI